MFAVSVGVLTVTLLLAIYLIRHQGGLSNRFMGIDGTAGYINCKEGVTVIKATYGPVAAGACATAEVTEAVQNLLDASGGSFVVSAPAVGAQSCGVGQLAFSYKCSATEGLKVRRRPAPAARDIRFQAKSAG